MDEAGSERRWCRVALDLHWAVRGAQAGVEGTWAEAVMGPNHEQQEHSLRVTQRGGILHGQHDRRTCRPRSRVP